MRTHTERVCALIGVAVLAVVIVSPGPAQAVGKELYPNLVPWAPYDLQVSFADGYVTPPPYALRFSVTTGNRGEVALDFQAQDSNEQTQTAVAAQCVRWVLKRVCTERRAAGNYVYHPAHGHYHIDSFASYEIHTLGPDGRPDMEPAGRVAGGQKVSFCMLDSTNDGASRLQLANPLYASCQLGTQGISAGYADTYDYLLPDQQILLDGIPDGIYALVVQVDPLQRLFEEPRTDNTSYTTFELLDGGTQVQVL